MVARFKSAPTPRPPPAAEVSQARVLIYNIAHGRGPSGGNWDGPTADDRARVAQIAEMILRESPDIVILNEVDFDSTWSGHQNQARAIADEAGFSHIMEQRNFDLRFVYGSWKFGNAVLSKFPIVSAQSIDYPNLSGWEHLFTGSKQGSVCTLQLSATQQLRVIPVHLEHRSRTTRIGSAQTLIATAAASPIPTLAAGDFNSVKSVHADAQAKEPAGTAIDLLRESQAFNFPPPSGLANEEGEPTFPSHAPKRQIDWILAPAGWSFSEYRVLEDVLSDHRAVLAVLNITPP